MRAVNRKSGKTVEYWVVSHKTLKPQWIEHLFYIGKMGWITDNALRYGWISMRGEGYRLNIGDVFLFDGKKIKFVSPKNFEKRYIIIDE